MIINTEVLKAIKDAKEFLEVVADDRCNAYISYQRQDEVVKILDKFLGNKEATNDKT